MSESSGNELPIDQRISELLAVNRALEKRVNQFSRIEQELIRARDQLDRESTGLRAICSFSQEALSCEDFHCVYELGVDAAVEAIDTECAVLFLRDSSSGYYQAVATCCLDAEDLEIPENRAWEEMFSCQIAEQKPFITSLPPAFQAVLNPSAEHMFILPMAHRDASLRGFIAAGVSTDKTPFFPPLTDERLTTAEAFLKQFLAIEDVYVQRAERLRVEKVSRENAARFRSLFAEAPIPLVEADLSVVKRWIRGRILSHGLEPEAFFEEHPDAIRACVRHVRVTDVNRQAVLLYEADSRQDLIQNIHSILVEESFEAFTRFLCKTLRGDTSPTRSRHHTLKGNSVDVEILAAIADTMTAGKGDAWQNVHLALRHLPAAQQSPKLIQLDPDTESPRKRQA